jgi:small basic protein (TIGR04137 family)
VRANTLLEQGSSLEKSMSEVNVANSFAGLALVTFSSLTLLFFPKSMSQHRSLKGASTIAAKRNVLKRFERVELLKKRGQWKEGQKVLGLPKTKPDL